MAPMSGNDKSSIRDFGDTFQLTNRILYSGEKFHMTPQVSYFIPGLLEDTYKYIEFAHGHPVTEKQRGQVQIKSTRSMRWVIFDYYVNEFGTYLFISQKFLHGVLWR